MGLRLALLAFFLIIGCESQHMPEIHPPRVTVDAKDKPLQIGLDSTNISPPKHLKGPYYLAGYGKGREMTSVHDDIWARTVVFEMDNKSVAVVSLDLIGFFHNHVDVLRSRVTTDELIVHATHNHEAPDTMGLWGPLLRSGVHSEYLEYVKDKIVESVNTAAKRVQPASISIAKSSTAALELVKDTRKPIVIPDELTIFTLNTANKPLGHIIHWHCHPEALGPHNQELTSDYPHFVREIFEKQFPGTTAIFWSGALGGLMAPNDFVTTEQGEKLREGRFSYTVEFGRQLANFAIETLEKSTPLPVPRLIVAREIFDMRLDNFKLALGTKIGILKRDLPSWSSVRTEVALLQLGDYSIQTVPGEIYPELVFGPLDPPARSDFPDAPRESPPLKDLYPRKQGIILGLGQDELGYIIPKNGWDEEAPYLGPEHLDSYGEEVSAGPETAAALHAAVERVSKLVAEQF